MYSAFWFWIFIWKQLLIMKTFEYQILRICDIFDDEVQTDLNNRGKVGWELVSSYQETVTQGFTHWHIFVFKREIQDGSAPKQTS